MVRTLTCISLLHHNSTSVYVITLQLLQLSQVRLTGNLAVLLMHILKKWIKDQSCGECASFIGTSNNHAAEQQATDVHNWVGDLRQRSRLENLLMNTP